MNGTAKKRILSVAAVLALAVGLYAVGDGYAHGPGVNQTSMGGQTMMGPGMMMGGQQGTTGYPGMGPGMTGNRTGGMGMMMNRMGGQQGMGPGMMGDHMMGGPMGFARLTTDTVAVETWLTDLKTRLDITTAQEQAWNSYAEAIKSQITTHTDIHNTVHGTVPENPLDRTGQHLSAMERMVGQNKAVFQAFRTLYEQLDETQRTAANQLSWPCHS